MTALTLQHLTVSYEKNPVLWDINLSVPTGKLIGIIGPNGAGKTSLIKAVLGLVPHLSGKVEFFGQTLKETRRRIAYVPQRESVDWDFPITVLDLVLMGRYGRLGLIQWIRKADREAAQRYLKMVGMEEFKDRQISQLSGGQQQRVFLARALLQEAEIYFFDEPFAGIDLATEKLVVDILKDLRDRGKTIFIVHHDLNSVESYFDWLIILNMRLVACGEVEDVFTPEMLNLAYGKNFSLFEEALKLSEKKTTGIS